MAPARRHRSAGNLLGITIIRCLQNLPARLDPPEIPRDNRQSDHLPFQRTLFRRYPVELTCTGNHSQPFTQKVFDWSNDARIIEPSA